MLETASVHARSRVLPAIALILALTACHPHAEQTHESGPPRAMFVAQLEALAARIVAGDEVAVRASLVAPPTMPEPQVMELVRALIRQGGVTVEGAKALETGGQYGLLGRVFPMAGPDEAKRLQVDPRSCYALKLRDTEIMAHWDGARFRFFRLDNIGKAARP
jgi:hypothetical protein